MCIALRTTYACGHESTSPMCKKRVCKKNEMHTNTKNYACTKCSHGYMTELQEECDESKRRLHDSDSAYAQALERIEAMEVGYRSVKLDNVQLNKQLKTLRQRTSEKQGDSMSRNESLAAELQTVRLKIPKNEFIFTEILRYYACGHDTKETCSTNSTPREDCQYRQVLGTECDEKCANCQTQDEANYEATLMRLTTAHPAQDRTVRDLRAQVQALQELYVNRKDTSGTLNAPVFQSASRGGLSAKPPGSVEAINQHKDPDVISGPKRLSVVKIIQCLHNSLESTLLEGGALIEEAEIPKAIEDQRDGCNTGGASCVTTMDEHGEKDILRTNASPSAQDVHTGTFELVQGSQAPDNKPHEQKEPKSYDHDRG
ncbi:hypothetical protein NX059_003372 [Plenodomus lindquistii]|nr:hypothetical protein NX059_003372 [Plenodomus lindquistii]